MESSEQQELKLKKTNPRVNFLTSSIDENLSKLSPKANRRSSVQLIKTGEEVEEDSIKKRIKIFRSKSDELLFTNSWDKLDLEEAQKRFNAFRQKEEMAEIGTRTSPFNKTLECDNDYLEMLEEDEEEEEEISDDDETSSQPPKPLETREEDKLLIGLKPGGEEELLGGTWDALVEGLTSKRFGKIIWDQTNLNLRGNSLMSVESPGSLITPQFVKEFFFTYRYFAEVGKPLPPAQELLTRLTSQYPLSLPPDATPELQSLQGTIQLRIIGIIKHWVENHFYDFEEDPRLYEHLITFVVTILGSDSSLSNTGVKIWSRYMFRILSERLVDTMKKGNKEPTLFALRTQVELGTAMSLEGLSILLQECEFVFDYTTADGSTKRAFEGIDIVEWIGKKLLVNKPEDAMAICQLLLNNGFIAHATDKPALVFSANELYFFILKKTSQGKQDEYPKPIIPSKTEGLSVMDINPIELVRQLTLADFECLSKITPRELSHQSWNKTDARVRAPHIINMIERFNRISFWVATEIVTCANYKNRVALLKRFITIAEECKKINNFSSMLAIIVGLNQGSVTRLKETWKGLSKTFSTLGTSLNEFINTTHNHRTYRAAYKKAFHSPNVPVIPYLAVNLRDLTFIEDGNQDFRPSGMVNFEKMSMLSKVFSEIHECQRRPFRFQKIDFIQKFLNEGHVITDDKELYKYSAMAEGSIRGTIGPSTSRSKVYPTMDSLFDRKKTARSEEHLIASPTPNDTVNSNSMVSLSSGGRKLSLKNTFSKKKKDDKKKEEKLNIKIALAGDGMVGKSALLKSFKDKTSSMNSYLSTLTEIIEVDKIMDEQSIHFQIIDVGASEDLLKSRISAYNEADYILVCYAVNNPGSFKNISEKWIPEIHKHAPNSLIVFVGCKEDLKEVAKEKTIPLEDGDSLCSKANGLFHVQCSIQRPSKIEDIFEKLVKINKKKKKKSKK